MNFVTPFAALAIAVSGLFAVNNPAEAGTNCYDTTKSYRICHTDNGHYGTDYINVYDLRSGNKVLGMDVICTGNGGYRWRSVSNFPKNISDQFAKEWCGNYN